MIRYRPNLHAILGSHAICLSLLVVGHDVLDELQMKVEIRR